MARGTIITRTTKKGEKRYHAALWTEKADGTRKQVWRTFELKRDAEAYLDAQSQLARQGEFIEPSRLTFGQFAEEWLEKYPQLTQLKGSSLEAYHSIIKRHLLPAFGPMRLTAIKAATIERDFKAALAHDRTPKTQRNILLVLRRMLETAVQWDYLRINPFHLRGKVTLPKRDDSQKGRALNPDEIKRLLDACQEEAYPIVATAVLTGMRRGEVFGLKWTDVDFQKMQIHVQRAVWWKRSRMWETRGYEFATPKSRMSVRRIDMSSELKRILLEHKLRRPAKEMNLVFAKEEGTPVDPGPFIRDLFKPAVERAGLGSLRFHRPETYLWEFENRARGKSQVHSNPNGTCFDQNHPGHLRPLAERLKSRGSRTHGPPAFRGGWENLKFLLTGVRWNSLSPA
jgi:integrase